MTDFLITNDPASIGGALDTTAGRFDPLYAEHAAKFPITGFVVHHVPDATNEFWVQFGFYHVWYDHYYNDANAFPFWFDNGSIWACIRYVDGDPVLRVFDAPGGTATDLAITIPDQVLCVVDIHVIRDNGDGTATIEVYIDDLLQATQTLTRGGGTVSSRFGLGASIRWTSDGTAFHNLRISDTSTLGKRFKALPLNAVGAYDQFVGGGFAALGDSNAASHAHADVVGQRVSGTVDHTLLDAGAGTITSVSLVTKTRIEGPTANPNTLAHFIRSGGSDYDQAPVTPTPEASQIVTTLAQNPATAAAWALADLNGMEFGLVASHV